MQKPARALSASSPTIHGWKVYPSRECESVIWRTFDAIRIDCSERRQVQNGKNQRRTRFTGPEHLFNRRRPGWYPSWYRYYNPYSQIESTPIQSQSDFAILWGKAKPVELIEHGGCRTRQALRAISSPIYAAWFAVFSRWPLARIGSTGQRFLIYSEVFFPGVTTSRDPLLVDIDLNRLKSA